MYVTSVLVTTYNSLIQEDLQYYQIFTFIPIDPGHESTPSVELPRSFFTLPHFLTQVINRHIIIETFYVRLLFQKT